MPVVKKISRFLLCLLFLGSGMKLMAQAGFRSLPISTSLEKFSVTRLILNPPSNSILVKSGAPDFEISSNSISTTSILLHPAPVVQSLKYDPAFFCRIENQLDKKTRLPVRFRLGEVGYANWREYGW